MAAANCPYDCAACGTFRLCLYTTPPKPVQLAELKLRRLRQIRIDDSGALGFEDMRIGDQLKQILALDAIDTELILGVCDLDSAR